MEPRINHGQPGWLGAWLQDRCHQGLEVPEAECLYMRMYRRSGPIYDYALGEAVFHRLQPGLG
jgi:hypothetical protein